MKRIVTALLLAIGLTLFSQSPSYAFLDKTRFVAHLGVAYFCFHHWVLKPYEGGAFESGAPHRTASIVKAGAALLFAVHEVRVAEKIAHTSKDPLLQHLDGGITQMMRSFSAIGNNFKQGKFNPEDVATLKTQTGSISQQAAQDGATIKDVPVSVPGI